MKNVVIIGGGTGLSVMLRGMKTIPGVELSAIVTVADDGGSTGRLRDSYQIPAMGESLSVISIRVSASQISPRVSIFSIAMTIGVFCLSRSEVKYAALSWTVPRIGCTTIWGIPSAAAYSIDLSTASSEAFLPSASIAA